MLEIAIFISLLVVFGLGVVVGTVTAGRPKVATGHEHEATYANAKGWFCECGKHKHVYFLTVAGAGKQRCQCGAMGIGKEWAK